MEAHVLFCLPRLSIGLSNWSIRRMIWLAGDGPMRMIYRLYIHWRAINKYLYIGEKQTIVFPGIAPTQSILIRCFLSQSCDRLRRLIKMRGLARPKSIFVIFSMVFFRPWKFEVLIAANFNLSFPIIKVQTLKW